MLAAPGPFAGIARLLAADYAAALGVATEVVVIPAETLLAASRALVEKRLAPGFDVLVHGWFDVSSEAPPAAVHREFFGRDGAFRVGPAHEGFATSTRGWPPSWTRTSWSAPPSRSTGSSTTRRWRCSCARRRRCTR